MRQGSCDSEERKNEFDFLFYFIINSAGYVVHCVVRPRQIDGTAAHLWSHSAAQECQLYARGYGEYPGSIGELNRRIESEN